MTDIVERLRDADYKNAPSRCMEAAREIGQLRFELKAARNEIEIADGEIERLKALSAPPAMPRGEAQ